MLSFIKNLSWDKVVYALSVVAAFVVGMLVKGGDKAKVVYRIGRMKIKGDGNTQSLLSGNSDDIPDALPSRKEMKKVYKQEYGKEWRTYWRKRNK